MKKKVGRRRVWKKTSSGEWYENMWFWVTVLLLVYIIFVPSSESEDKAMDEGDSSLEGYIAIMCGQKVYRCNDFSTFSDAEKVFAYCKNKPFRDVHNLDADNNDIPCEGLSP
jgi:hypothetical protein